MNNKLINSFSIILIIFSIIFYTLFYKLGISLPEINKS